MGSALIQDATRKDKKGFTLVELSIVIVIVGLIIAGVSAGRSLVQNARLAAVVNDLAKYESAVNTFRTTYNGLPGDIRNATSYWTGGVTADGDGNGNIYRGAYSSGEWKRSWEQLALSGIIKGSYNGSNATHAPGVDLPAGSIPKSGYLVYHNTIAGTGSFDSTYGKAGLLIHFAKASSTNWLEDPVLTPKEAYSIDLKKDDGIPSSGSIMARRGINISPYTNCITSATENVAPGTYTQSYNNLSCQLYYFIGK